MGTTGSMRCNVSLLHAVMVFEDPDRISAKTPLQISHATHSSGKVAGHMRIGYRLILRGWNTFSVSATNRWTQRKFTVFNTVRMAPSNSPTLDMSPTDTAEQVSSSDDSSSESSEDVDTPYSAKELAALVKVLQVCSSLSAGSFDAIYLAETAD